MKHGPFHFIFAMLFVWTMSVSLRADDTFVKGADGAPHSLTQPYVGSDNGTGGMPVAARQISVGPHGKAVTLGTPEHPVTLPQLLDEALRHNPATKSAWEQTLVSLANVGVARSAYYPTVTLDGNAQPSHQTTPAYEGGGNSDSITYGPEIQVQYLLLDFGARAAGVEAARFQLLADNYSFNSAIQTTLLQVEQNYYTLQGDKENVINDQVSVDLAQHTYDSAKVKASVGLGTQTQVLQAEQQVAQAKYNLVAAQGQVSTDEVALATSIGLPGNAVLYVAPPGHLPTASQVSDSVDVMIDKALRQRPDLAAKYATYHQYKASANQAQDNIAPQLTVGASAERSFYHTTITGEPSSIPGTLGGNGTYNGHTDDATAQLTFSIDLFDGFYKINQSRLAHHQADVAEANLATAELTVISDVVSKFVAFKSALEETAAGEALVASSQKSFESTDASYKYGLASIIDQLTAQSALATARTTLAQSRTALFTSSAQLANATGTLLPQGTLAAAKFPAPETGVKSVSTDMPVQVPSSSTPPLPHP